MDAPCAFLDRNGARLRYVIEGRGQAVLLIHEMGGALESWNAVVSELGWGWEILRYDQRGHGQSTTISGVADLDVLVEDAVAVLDASGLTAPPLVVASALGCATAVRLAARHPERVAGLLLLTPALGVPEERRAGARGVADRIEAEGVESFVGATLDLAYPVRYRSPPDRFDAFRAIQFATDSQSLAAYWRMLAEIDLGVDIGRLSAPITILTGVADEIRPPDQVPRLPGAAFHIVDSGHFMAMQSPATVAAAILVSGAWQGTQEPADFEQ